MHRTSLLPALLMAIVVASLHASPQPAGAQPDASPEPTFPVTPDPAACTVEPRSTESLAALLGTPVAGDAPAGSAQLPEPIVASVPVGQPADEKVTEDVIVTVAEFYACFNAGDSRRAFALASDAFLQRYVENNALTADEIAALIAEPEPVPVEVQATILAVTDVTVLPDGRVGAFVVTTSEWRGLDTGYLLFVQQGERWLLDEAIPFLAG